MATRALNRLSAMKVDKIKTNGRFADGGGLYLQVRGDSKTWVFRYASRTDGREHDLGIGPLHTVPLARARELAQRHRAALLAGNDPLAARRALHMAEKLARARALTFGACVERYIEAHSVSWRNAKHCAQWTATLKTHAALLWPAPVADVDTPLVVKSLEAIWSTKTETATRVRQRIEAVLDWAAVRDFRSPTNPARWRGHLEKLLPAPAKLKNVTPRVALPHDDVAEFMTKLRNHDGLGARALELQILTATRPGEAAGAQWGEIDLDAATWTIPGSRMKANREHRVPLSASAVVLLRALPRDSRVTHVFPGVKGKPLTTAAMLKAARAVRAGIDAHGFRSTFRDWAAERATTYSREVIESALAHRLKDKAEAAYFRSDLFDRRARLMRDWARYCDTPPAAGNVSSIKKRVKA